MIFKKKTFVIIFSKHLFFFFYKEKYNQISYDLYQYDVQSNYNFQKQSITLVIVQFYNFVLSSINKYIHTYIHKYLHM